MAGSALRHDAQPHGWPAIVFWTAASRCRAAWSPRPLLALLWAGGGTLALASFDLASGVWRATRGLAGHNTKPRAHWSLRIDYCAVFGDCGTLA